MKAVEKKAPISLNAVETLIEEVITEGTREYETIKKSLMRSRAGSERRRSLLCDMSVAASILETKAKTAQEAIDEYLESLPDDDD